MGELAISDPNQNRTQLNLQIAVQKKAMANERQVVQLLESLPSPGKMPGKGEELDVKA